MADVMTADVKTVDSRTVDAIPSVRELINEDMRVWAPHFDVADDQPLTRRMMFSLMYRFAGFRAVYWIRIGQWGHRNRVRGMSLLIQNHLHRRYGLEIAVGTPIGGGLYIPHTVGQVIYPRRIGRRCSIIAGVTIGMRTVWEFPAIGDNVVIGAGARVLGGISIGDGAVIGANAVVIHDVPPGATVVGIPGRVLKINTGAYASPARGLMTAEAVTASAASSSGIG